MFMLAACIIGTSIKHLAKTCQLPRAFIAPRVKRLRVNKVWNWQRINVEWFDLPDDDQILTCIICDAMVAEGLLSRSHTEKEAAA